MARHVKISSAVLVLTFVGLLHYHHHQQQTPRPHTPPSTHHVHPNTYPYPVDADLLHTDASSYFDDRGLVTWTPHAGAPHPIEALMERGARLAHEMEERIAGVKTVHDSAEDYVAAFGIDPPRGFESWYRYTQHTPEPRPPPLPSLIPLAHTPFLPFLSHPAHLLRERVETVREDETIFTLTFVPDGQGDDGTACQADQDWFPDDWHVRGKGRVLLQGAGSWSWRCNNTLSLLLPILPLMPEEMFTQSPPLELAFSLDDAPRGMIHNSLREKSETLARVGKIWQETQLNKAEQAMRWTYGWAWSCPEDTPLKTSSVDINLNEDDLDDDNTDVKTFVADFDRAIDYCSNTELMSLHHALLSEKHRAAVELIPVVATCRTKWNSDIVGVPLDGVHEKVPFIPWEQKSIGKVFWRGTATGLFHSKNRPWRQSQRERLHWFGTNTTGTVPLLLPDGTVKDWPRKEIVEQWLDIGLSGGPVQCLEADGSCADMAKEIDFKARVNKEDGAKFKFVVDVDGNGWSSRFRRLLQGNNVVFKSTIYTEWFNEMLIPWYHYVPTKLDYSDILDTLAFFKGSPDGSIPGRDDLAKEMSKNAHDFVQKRWRDEDMRSFMYLLLLEYWRVMSDDRDQASYQP